MSLAHKQNLNINMQVKNAFYHIHFTLISQIQA